MRPSPEIYPHAYELSVDMVYGVRLSEEEFRAASFLDARGLPPGRGGEWLPWPELVARVGAELAPAGCDYIFHIGHVGSTLLSRLLGQHARVFSLREPTPLRTLAGAEIDVALPQSLISPERFDTRLDQLIGLLSRTWRPEQKSLVKGTSTVCALADRLLARDPAARALMMYVPPEPFLASTFGAPNSIHDLWETAPLHLRRLHRALDDTPFRLHALSPGEMAAMSWATEMMALAGAARGRQTRVLKIDFEAFLAAPEAGLARAFGQLGLEAPAAGIEALVRSPIMTRYSKKPEHAYSAELRREILDLGRAAEPDEIRKGLAWLETAARAHPAIGAGLDFAAPPD